MDRKSTAFKCGSKDFYFFKLTFCLVHINIKRAEFHLTGCNCLAAESSL